MVLLKDFLSKLNEMEEDAYTQHPYEPRFPGIAIPHENSGEQKDELGEWVLKTYRTKAENPNFSFVSSFRKDFGCKDLKLFHAIFVFGTPKYAEEYLEEKHKIKTIKGYTNKRIPALLKKLLSEIEAKLLSGELTATGIDNDQYSLGEREELSKDTWQFYRPNGVLKMDYCNTMIPNKPNWRDILISQAENPKTTIHLKKNSGGRPSKHDWAHIAAIVVSYMWEHGEPDPKQRGAQAKAVEYLLNVMEAEGYPQLSESDAKAFIKDCGERITRIKLSHRKAEN